MSAAISPVPPPSASEPLKSVDGFSMSASRTSHIATLTLACWLFFPDAPHYALSPSVVVLWSV